MNNRRELSAEARGAVGLAVERSAMFPEYPRVHFAKNPLVGVIATLHFPPQLSIGTEVPSAYQKLIKGAYPYYSRRSSDYDPSAPVQEASGNAIAISVPGDVPVVHVFSSPDGSHTITLSANEFSYVSIDYETWEDFSEQVHGPLRDFIKVYNPVCFTDLELQMLDVIVRSRLGLEGEDWKKLLKPEILGLLGVGEIENSEVAGLQSTTRLLIDEKTYMQIEAGLGNTPGQPEQGFIINTLAVDPGPIPADDGYQRALDHMHDYTSRCFRWAILDPLYQAMEPVEMEETSA